jgi:hypothetical protein
MRKGEALGREVIALEKYKDHINVKNNALNQINMLLIKRMTKIDKQMDEAVKYAWIVRTNARKVGGDILHYHQSLAKTDVFLTKIENHGFAFLPLARDMVGEKH